MAIPIAVIFHIFARLDSLMLASCPGAEGKAGVVPASPSRMTSPALCSEMRP
jgi:hypothetical protein